MTDEDAASSSELSRRAFLKKMAAVGFAVPIVTSFALDGVASATDHDHDHRHPNQTYPNQTYPNQAIPNQIVELVDRVVDQLFPNQGPV